MLLSELQQIMFHFMRGILTSQRAATIFLQKLGTSAPVSRIAAIMRVPEVPITPRPESIARGQMSVSGRKKSHPWSEYEDQRLLCAITRFGLDNWTVVSHFVGNQRTRAQCAQRWFRGLDPRISRVLWTREEEVRLAELVEQHGLRAWTRIARDLGRRSDAQCRYHYYQMIRGACHEGDEAKPVVSSTNSPISPSSPIGLVPRKQLLPPINLLIGVGL
jgi:hypothetical protein